MAAAAANRRRRRRLLLLLLLMSRTARANESVVVGVKGRDFVMLAADAAFRRGLVAMDAAHDKIARLDDAQLLAAVGEVGAAEEFCDVIRQSFALHRLQCESRVTADMAKHFLRRHVASTRLDRGALPDFKLLFAALEADVHLAWLDETGAVLDLDYAAHGLGSSLVLGLLDRSYRKDLSRKEALELLHRCLDQLHDRYAASTSAGFLVKVLSREEDVVCDVLRWRAPSAAPSSSSSSEESRSSVFFGNAERAPPTSLMRLATYASRRSPLRPSSATPHQTMITSSLSE
mmetsp:Transcript_19230/g.59322  ORF Transcript_19230/g.59322 Transcript_19230/m.59322 type:complete len:289 (-) Transcript_19230:68-934(-)